MVIEDCLLFVLNHLAKCQAYFMLEYGAYASMCHVTHLASAKFRFVLGPCLLCEEFEFERQTFGRCTVVNSFVKRCAHKICALFYGAGRRAAHGARLRPRSPLDSVLYALRSVAWELASNCPGHQGACLAIDSQVQLCQLLAVPFALAILSIRPPLLQPGGTESSTAARFICQPQTAPAEPL